MAARKRKEADETPDGDGLSSLRALLDRLPPEAVKEPRVPIAKLAAEALALAATAEELREELLAKRLEAEHLDHLGVLARALSMAQAELDASRGARRSQTELALEAQAVELRRDMVTAGRFALRGDRNALAAIDRVQDGKGLADLAQDLVDLAALFDLHARALAKVGAEPEPLAERARTLSKTLVLEVARRHSSSRGPSETREVRDRIASLLIETMAEVRAAGAFTFRKNPRALAKFHSSYNVAKRRRRGKTED